jgi:autotransporter-associated beta strand protein
VPLPSTEIRHHAFRSLVRGFVILFTVAALQSQLHAQRLLGLDISAWQGNISQTTWNNLRTVENRQFVFIRSSRGGTTGFYNQNDADNSDGNNTLSQRYDDPYFVQNINRATAAGIYAGPYHFSRPDIIESTLNSGAVRNTGANEADHFIQMAGPWMRPGYLVPIHDLEAGDGIRTDNEMAQFAVDFSNRIFERMGIRPGIYINGNYTANILQPASQSLRDQLARPPANSPSVYAPAYPVLWVARWPNQTNPNAIDVQGTNPKDTYSGFYGPWDDYGDPNPWDFWQYASTARLPSFNNGANNLDVNVLRGDMESLKDQLVPAVWLNDSSGDWSTLANWNSGQTPIAPVPGPGQVTPIGTQTLPVPRLPGAAGTGVTSGRNDTVILERTNANVTVTLSSGIHNIRKLYLREALNITGGSLTINYDPTYASNPAFPNTARSGPISAQFSAPVTLSGGNLNVHTLQVDATRNFTLSGGALAFNKISLMPGTTPARLLLNGDVAISALGASTAIITNGTGAGNSGSIDLAGTVTTLTVADTAAEIDLSVDVSIFNGPSGTNRALVKAGPGTMRLTRDNGVYGGTTISAGRLFVNNTRVSGTSAGLGDVTVNAGVLGGTGNIIGDVTINPDGIIAPGDATSIGTLSLWDPPTLNGTTLLRINRDGGSRTADQLAVANLRIVYRGNLVVTNIGPPLLGGETFKHFSAPAYLGTFSNVILPPLSAGLNWDTNTLRTSGSIVVNRAPVPNPITLTNYPPAILEIPIVILRTNATDADGDNLQLTSINLVTTNGVTLTTNNTHIFYASNLPVPDQFTYTITDNRGGQATGTVYITNNPAARFASAPILNTSGLTLQLVGRPGVTYHLDRSTNLLTWLTISTNTAPANGLFQYFDPNPPNPAAFYKLQTAE